MSYIFYCSSNLQHRKRKAYFLVSERQRFRNNKLIEKYLEISDDLCRSLSLQIKSVNLEPLNLSNSTGRIKINIEDESDSNDGTLEEQIFKTLQAKDESNLSKRKYRNFRAKLSYLKLPSFYRLRKLQTKLDNLFKISINEFGVYNDPLQKISFACSKFLEENKLINDETFIIKLAADGKSLTKSRVNLLNFTFTIINDAKKAKTSAGNYSLGMFEILCETYDEVKGSVEDLLKKLEQIISININSKEYKIKYKVGGDMKILAIFFGINAANSNHPCLWCNCNLALPVNMKAKWPICRNQSDAAKQYLEQIDGYINEPIIKFVEFEDIVIDTLHLLLRISDKLFNLLLEKIEINDGNDSADLNKRPLLRAYLDFLKNTCKLTKPYYIKTNENNVCTIKIRNFSGLERLKIFKCFYSDNKSMQSYFPSTFDLDETNICWLKFYKIFQKIKSFSDSNVPPADFDCELQKWLEWYMLINNGETITPYIHAFVFHMPEFLRKHKDVNLYNVQGLEKLNDLTMQYYQTATNKHKTNNNYLNQLLKKRNRIEFYNLNGKLSDFFTPLDRLSSNQP